VKRVLVTGAGGQIGSELVPALRRGLGDTAVMATDLRPLEGDLAEAGPSAVVDCLDAAAVAEAASRHDADTVFHLAAILSATAERDPMRAWRVNMETLANVLEAARERRLALFVPSSVAAFGPSTPPDPAPQDTLQRPTSVYGVSKVAGELLCDYYWQRWGVDTRGLRYPGLISHSAPPGGGTTDYAVAIFHHAVGDGRYTCFLAADTRLDMMYMPDAVRAAIELMDADPVRLEHRNAFNVTAMQLTPARLAEEIRRHLPGFEIAYDVDPVRQRIAESWPRRMDDAAAREEWGWRPEYDVARMTADMLEHVAARLAAHATAD
jgi:nucleoside-diphosphate-sugar epimerase